MPKLPSGFLLLTLLSCGSGFCQSATSSGPLVVDAHSHVVVMEYEAWFGPRAVTFAGTAAKPFLQSADMQPLGGGYDSADPHVIQPHVAWMQSLGVDAAISDLSNNASCIFNSQWFIKKYLPYCTPAFRVSNQAIRDNTANLFPAWTNLNTPLKLIPLLDGGDETVMYQDLDGANALQKEIDFFGRLFADFPDRQVIYEGKPLMLIFLGAAQDPYRPAHPLWFQIRRFLANHPEISGKYNLKLMAGYLDSQPDLWLHHGTPTGPVEINPEFGFWSWVDRLNTACVQPLCPYYPSYNQVGDRAENLTVSIATAGGDGWQCLAAETAPYCPDDALRYGPDHAYTTFASFMDYARQLDPIFLIIHQWNEFVPPDEGWNANTDDDIEPANLWGFGALDAVRQQLALYHQN